MLQALNRFLPFFGRNGHQSGNRHHHQHEPLQQKKQQQIVPASSVNHQLQEPALTTQNDDTGSWLTVSQSAMDDDRLLQFQRDYLQQQQVPIVTMLPDSANKTDDKALSKSQRLINGAIKQLKLRHRVEYLVCDDISNGHENLKIPAVSYRRDDAAPTNYHYVTDFVERELMNVDKSLKIMSPCTCQTDCADGTCNCTSYNKSGRYYDSTGRLAPEYDINSPEIVYECNVGCKCNPKTCNNRVIQRGLRYKVTLFRTKSRGWGVRTLETLKRGSFLGVYSGELITIESSWKREDDTYLFNLTCCNTYQQPPAVAQDEAKQTEDDDDDDEDDDDETVDGLTDEEQPPQLQSQSQSQEQQQQQQPKPQQQVQFVCDAKYFGNFTRFINHSCEPNVIGIRSFTNHQDTRFPYIAFYTNKDIPSSSELTLNYGDNYWLVKCKRDSMYCMCKRTCCRFNKKTYAQTLKEYKRQKERQQQQQQQQPQPQQ